MSNTIHLKHALKSASTVEMLTMLKKAEVTVGNFRGRHIHVPNYEGSVTFTEFSKAVDKLYLTTVSPMHEKQKKYEQDTAAPIDPLAVCKGKGGILALPLLPFTFAIAGIGKAINLAQTPSPTLEEHEIETILPVLIWRTAVDTEFNRLFNLSQEQVDMQAKNSCSGRLMKRWDAYLDTKSACSNKYLEDYNTFQTMQSKIDTSKIVRAVLIGAFATYLEPKVIEE